MSRTVAILGGTHGNETNGVFVVDSYKSNRALVHRPSFKDVLLVTTNTKAVKQNTRFVDADLNRRFPVSELRDHDALSDVYEAQRAKTLNMLLGPKPGSHLTEGDLSGAVDRTDFVIDLHTTTSNMGCCIIVPCDDPFSMRCAVYARSKMLAEDEGKSGTAPVKIFRVGLPRADTPYIASCGKHSLIIECGPTPWGVVRYDIVRLMQRCTKHILDYVDSIPAGELSDEGALAPTSAVPDAATVNVAIINPATGVPAKIPAPADEDGRPLAMFHPDLQDKDWRELRTGDPMFVRMDGVTVDRYDGRHGEVVKAHFVNEAAYYLPSSGLGFELSQEAELPLWGEEAKAERISALLTGNVDDDGAPAKKRRTK